MKFIIDKKINLNENDALNSGIYAKFLQTTIKNASKDKSFTI
jgi:hypothetical protein